MCLIYELYAISIFFQYPVQGSQDLEMGEITSDNGTEDEEVEKDSATTRRIATEGEKKVSLATDICIYHMTTV